MKKKNISKFVLDFIESHKDKPFNSIKSEWNSNDIQTSLKKVLINNTKNEKDVNKPKRGSSSYIHFCKDNRDTVKKKYPNYSNKEIVIELGLLWNKIKDNNPDELSKYEELAKKDRDRYNEQIKNYNNVQNDVEDKIEIEEDRNDEEVVHVVEKKKKKEKSNTRHDEVEVKVKVNVE